ncbi:ferritin-like domain-containing protein [Haladaptatus caseinilyticus]|uniref:ferritin-like domain-containing protein n=1 Tax=Haladaptatus caseinilyticus TaxID=2993314 RepID=UPI00224B81B2|nr:ferritin-like domain-containing protein [Haladaptatus caseinilyticus]
MTSNNDPPTDEQTIDSITDLCTDAKQQLNSRRDFLGKTAAGATALSLAATGVGSAHGDDSTCKDDDKMTDIDVLNYALTLEQLEATFYTRGQQMFTESEIESSDAAKRLGTSLQCSTYDYFNLIRDHEQTHVKRLTEVITDLGGTPVSGLEFEFPLDSVQQYFVLAQTFENLGVSAYDGAIALIENPDLQTAGATIATVEARHASYLNILNADVPFPTAFDEPKTMEEVLAAAGQFIVDQ